MSRCVHLHGGGVQCIAEAVSGGDFCDDHDPGERGFDRLEVHPLQKIAIRLLALLLLLVLLIPFYRSVRALYLAPVTETGEGG